MSENGFASGGFPEWVSEVPDDSGTRLPGDFRGMWQPATGRTEDRHTHHNGRGSLLRHTHPGGDTDHGHDADISGWEWRMELYPYLNAIRKRL